MRRRSTVPDSSESLRTRISTRIALPALAVTVLVCLALAGPRPASAQATDPNLALDARPPALADLDTERVKLEAGAVFEDEIEVGPRTYRIQAVDRRGQPIEGLGRRDFDIKLGDDFVKVEAIQWVGPGELDPSVEGLPGEEGRRFLIYVQAGREPIYGRAHLRLQRQLHEFLAALDERDLVGVVSYDARLKLWLDFTIDHELVERVVSVAGRFTAEPGNQLAAGNGPSLLAVWDAQESRQATHAEEGLETIARYMSQLPGDETMLYVGWGVGRFVSGSNSRTRLFDRATDALADARVQVFVLDVVGPDHDSVEVGLLDLASTTGGDYFRSRDLPEFRMRELAATLSAHYLLTLDAEDLALAIKNNPRRDLDTDLDIRLRFRDGRVYGPPRPVR